MSALLALGWLLLAGGLWVLTRFVLGEAQLRERLRELPLFTRLYQGLALALEAGWSVAYHLGARSLTGSGGGSLLLSLPVFRELGRWVLRGDRPPETTVGEGWAYLAARDIRQAWPAPENSASPGAVLSLPGLQPWEYVAGHVALSTVKPTELAVFFGSWGPEVGWMTETAEQRFGGTEDLLGQAVLYTTCDHSLVGDHWWVTGAYTQVGRAHLAGAWVYDALRWLLWWLLFLGAPLYLLLGGTG